MKVLHMKDLEKYSENMTVFPAFSLEVSQHEVVALYSSMNVRSTLLHMFIGKIPVSRGELSIDGITLSGNRMEYLNKLGISFLDDGLYERLTVKDYLIFAHKLSQSPWPIDEVLRTVQLEMKSNVRIHKLTQSEKRRVHFARLLMMNPALYVFEEPVQNVDNETKTVFSRVVATVSEQGKGVLILTGNMETALSVTNEVYRLDEKGLHRYEIVDETEEKEMPEPLYSPENQTMNSELDKEAGSGAITDSISEPSSSVQEDEPADIFVQPVRLEKIPTKMNDKMILFDPPEIDYIESSDGQSNIYVKGDAYPCVFKINELEERLQPFGFFRCHRSYIVNLQKVREVITYTRNSFSLVLDDQAKSSVPLSKAKMAELKEMLGLKA